jgi:hypothetical protein
MLQHAALLLLHELQDLHLHPSPLQLHVQSPTVNHKVRQMHNTTTLTQSMG